MPNNYGPRIVTDGLVLCLDAGNVKSYPGSGTTWTDISRNANNGTLVNGALYSSNNGGYITCDGTNDYIEVVNKNNLVFGSGNFSIEYWFRKLSATTGYDNIWGPNRWLIGGSAGSNEWYVGIGNGSSGSGENLQFGIESSTTSYSISTTQAVTLNFWYQLTAIRNGNLLQIYLNGSLLLSSTPAGFTASTAVNNVAARNLRINNSGYNGFHTNADNAILRIYNRAISSVEILQNYNATKGRFKL